MRYNILYPVFFLFISITGFSQTKKYLYYFDKDMNITTPSKSIFFGTGLNDNGVMELKCFSNASKSLVFLAHYTDSSLNIMNGLFQSYYTNGYLENEGNYVKGKETGLWQKWDTLGNLIDSSVYENGKKVMYGTFTYHQNGIMKSIVIYDMKNNKLDRATFYNEEGKIVDLKDLKESEDPDKVFTKAEIEASFPGGESAWTRYIKNVIVRNLDALTADHKSGKCLIRFIVDTAGNVTNVEPLTMKGSKLAEVSINAIRKGPKWTPAQQNGRFVNAYREQPVTFTIHE